MQIGLVIIRHNDSGLFEDSLKICNDYGAVFQHLSPIGKKMAEAFGDE